jgi:beta-lactamase class D
MMSKKISITLDQKIISFAVRFTSIALVFFSCIVLVLFQVIPPASTTPKLVVELPATGDVAQKANFEQHFRDLKVEGSTIIYDLKNDRTFQYNPERNLTAFPPASTFKILNSLISLETGVIADEIAVLTWDGITRDLPEWNRDLNMREAIKLSAVWFYQVLARRVGHNRMQEWVSKAGYGNQKVGDKEDIDKFWLDGTLRITPQEQIQFLQRLYNNNLPFSRRTISIVKDIMINEKTPEYTIRGKTGWFGFGNNLTPNIGWYIGYLEKGENVYFFATNINIRQKQDAAARIELTRRCLKDLQVL